MPIYGVQGQWTGTLEIDGRPVFLEFVDAWKEITIRSHIHMDLPTLTFCVKDKGAELLNNLKLSDGMKTVVGMSDGVNGMPSPQQFLLAGNPKLDPVPGAYLVTQKGLLNKPAWGKAIWDKSVDGKSGDVIKQLAAKAGLKADVDSTDDAMKWLGTNRSIASYARFVAEHAFSGQNNAIMTGITENGTYLFKDLNKLIGGSTKGRIGYGRGEIPYLEAQFDSKGVVYNAVRGYGSTTAQDMGDGILKELNAQGANLLSGSAGIGALFSQAVGALGTRVEYSPIDSGNTHKNYRQAVHQNRRVKGLYSEDVKVMIGQVTNFELLSKVHFSPIDMVTGKPLTNYVGEYLVTGKVRTLQKNRYFEILTLTTQGYSTAP